MDRTRKIANHLGTWFWGLSAAVLVLYGFGLVMGVFTPGEMLGWTIVAAVLALLLGWHAHKVHVALHDRDPELMRALNQAREERGF